MKQTRRSFFHCGPAQPASAKAYLLAAILLVSVILGFMLLVRADYIRPRAADMSAYTEACPDDLTWQLDETHAGGAYMLEGYAFIESERTEWFDAYVALYCPLDESLLQLSSAMVWTQAAANLPEMTRNGASGLAAFVREKDLKYPPQSYELCILYKTNHHQILLHTGQTLGGDTE